MLRNYEIRIIYILENPSFKNQSIDLYIKSSD